MTTTVINHGSRIYQTSPAVCNPTPPPTLQPIIDSSNACNQAFAPIVCRCMDQCNSQLPVLGVLGLSVTCFRQKFPLVDRHPHETHCSSGQAHSSSQTASPSVLPFSYGSQMLCGTIRCQWGWNPKIFFHSLGTSLSRRIGGASHLHKQRAQTFAFGSGDILADRNTQTYSSQYFATDPASKIKMQLPLKSCFLSTVEYSPTGRTDAIPLDNALR